MSRQIWHQQQNQENKRNGQVGKASSGQNERAADEGPWVFIDKVNKLWMEMRPETGQEMETLTSSSIGL